MTRLPRKWNSNITQVHACNQKSQYDVWHKWNETSYTLRGATGVTIQPHQVLRLPRKMTLMIDPPHIWNLIYIARNNSTHPPTSPNIAPATKNDIPKHEESVLKTDEASFKMADDSSMIRTQTRHLAPARSPRLLFALRRRILYGELHRFALQLSTQISPNTIRLLPRKVSWLILITDETSFTLRGATGLILQHHQILRNKLSWFMIDPPHIWNVQYCTCH